MENKKPIIFILASITLFVLVLIGVYVMMFLTEGSDANLGFIQYFIPIIVLTGFFIFIISAGLFIYGLIKLFKPSKASN